METNRLRDDTLTLGQYLRDSRSRLRPPLNTGHRRTPGLRREEVASLACVSVTWYTWLEQGRGGPPSGEVLERLARALELDAAGRELLFFLAHQRPPPLSVKQSDQVTPTLQRVLDAMPYSPVYVKNLTWDLVGWNNAAAALADYAPLPTGERNVLRRLFTMPVVQATLQDWDSEARFAVSAFRLDAARAGKNSQAAALVNELRAASPDFRRMWEEADTRRYGVQTRHVNHPRAGTISFECSTLDVNDSDGLHLLVYTPITRADAEAVQSLLK